MYSIVAGFIIAICSFIWIKVGGIAGAALFTWGLYTICVNGYDLYTGRIGFALDGEKKFIDYIGYILGNFMGVFTFDFLLVFSSLGGLVESSDFSVITDILGVRISSPVATLFLSVVCGFIMYHAVCGYRDNKPAVLFLGIPIFLLMGAPHCIVDMFYILLAETGVALKYLPLFCGVLVGNSVGAIAAHEIKKGYI